MSAKQSVFKLILRWDVALVDHRHDDAAYQVEGVQNIVLLMLRLTMGG